MSGAVLGILWRDGRPTDAATVQRALDGCPQRAVDGQAIWLGQGVALAHQHFFVKAEDFCDDQPIVQAADGGALVLSADLRLDNREELAALLGIGPAELRAMGDATLLLHAYRRWGTDCVRRLLGDFAFVLWDEAQQQLFAACDQVGARNLCYYADANTVIVASEVLHVLAFLDGKERLNEGKIADYLNLHTGHCQETLFEGIFYCLPAQCIQADRSGLWMWQFWNLLETPPLRYRRDDEYADHFKALLFEAVRSRLRSAGPIGVSLSGGLDSTTVAAIAAQEMSAAAPYRERVLSFSYVFDQLVSCDERAYIQPVVERFSLDAAYVNCDDCWALRDFERWPVERDIVMYDMYYRMQDRVQEVAQACDVRVMLTGEYGDYLFAGGAYWAADMLRDGHPAAVLAAAWKVGVRGRRDLFDWCLRPLAPVWLRGLYRRVAPRPAGHFAGLHPQLERKLGLERRYRQERRQLIAVSSDRWHRIRMLQDPTMHQGQPLVRRWYHGRRMEIESPFFDRRLVEFAAAAPAYVLGNFYRTKPILRSAMEGILPDKTRTRPDKTSFHPLFDAGLIARERAAVESLLANAEVVARGYVRREWIEEQRRRYGHWEDGGMELWLVLCLEMWLRRYGQKDTAAIKDFAVVV